VVDVQGASADILYDGTMLKDVSEISKAITAAGYPASVQSVLSPEELEAGWNLAEAKAQSYIASVGGWDISRSDFDTEMEIEKRKYARIYGENLLAGAQGIRLKTRLQSQIISRLLDEGVIMQEIEKAGFVIDPEEAERELAALVGKMGLGLSDFEASMSRQGNDFDYFKRQFERKVLINRYIEDTVTANASSPIDRENMLNAWYSNSKALAKVTYYDKDIEKIIGDLKAPSGCGSSCSLPRKG